MGNTLGSRELELGNRLQGSGLVSALGLWYRMRLGDPPTPSTNLPSHLLSLLVPLTGVAALIFPLPAELACSFVLVLGLWEQHLCEPPGASGLEGRRRRRLQHQSQGRTMAGEAGSCQLPTATRTGFCRAGLGLRLASVPGPAPALTSLPAWP